jgi:MFS family permease
MQKNSAFKFVLLLSFVSLFGDFVYEGARSITGPFLAELGASAIVVGAVSGFGELLGYALRLVSGRTADKTRAYWTITIIGYCINLLSVPALALAGNWPVAALLLLAERTGKAIRGPARDVMLSAAGTQLGSGFAFGLHQALDQVGAIVGPLTLAAILAMHQSPRFGFSILLAPAVVALILLGIAKFLYPNPEELRVQTNDVHAEGLDKTFWLYVAGGSLVAAGTMDYPLIAFHFHKIGSVSATLIPIFYAVGMATDGLAALILGKLFDRAGVRLLAAVSLVTASVSAFIFLTTAMWSAIAGVAIWGVGLGAQSSIMKAVIAKLVPAERRGSAYGVFGLMYGLSWFTGSLLMGFLYEHSLFALIAFSVATQLLAVPIFIVVAKRM